MTNECLHGKRRWIATGYGLSLLAAGCSQFRNHEPVSVRNLWLGPAVVAVAPALNLSGSTDFDPVRFADLMASELSYVEGVTVVPVSRTLAALAADGTDRVESPTHALELARTLGADSILVFAVTEYDPYVPPTIGISAQLYGRLGEADRMLPDPASFALRPAGTGPPRRTPRTSPLARVQRVFDASNNDVVEDIKRFAAKRSAGGSAFGWRRYVVSQQEYIRYCCHAVIRNMVNGQRVSERVGATRG